MYRTTFRKIFRTRSVLSHLVIIVVLLILVFLPNHSTTVETVQADEGGHSHGRFGHIMWEAKDGDPPNSARITFTAGFRRNGFTCRNPLSGGVVSCSGIDGLPGVGDVVLETIGGSRIDNFGDGSSTPTLYFKVFSININDNWLMARALQPGTADQEYILHSYAGTGPFTVVSESCCRINALSAPNAHINNPGLDYRFATVIDFSTRASPISLLPPIVDCPRESICTLSSNKKSSEVKFTDFGTF